MPPTTEPQADAEPGVNAEPQVQLNINAEPLVEQLPPTTEPQADAEPGVNAEPQIQLNINAEPLVEQLPPTTEPQADAEPGVNAEPQVQMNINAEPRVEQLPSDDPFLYTGQNARGVVRCVECRKPRVYYCKNKLSSRQLILLDRAVTEFDYTCGAPLSDPDDTKSVLKYVAVRKNLSCSHPIELAYYSSSIGKADICCYCGEENAYRDLELKKKYKTVLPICQECELKGKSSFVQRPFGKRQ